MGNPIVVTDQGEMGDGAVGDERGGDVGEASEVLKTSEWPSD